MNELKRILCPIAANNNDTWNQMLYWWCALATVSGVILIRAQSGDVFPAWTTLTLEERLVRHVVVLWMNTSHGRFDYQQLAGTLKLNIPNCTHFAYAINSSRS